MAKFFSNFKNQLVGIVLIISGIVIYFGLYNFNKQKQRVRNEKYDELHAILQLKVNQLNQWHKERFSETSFFTMTPPFSNYSLEVSKGINNHKLNLQNSLSHIMSEGRYSLIFMLNRNGKILFNVTNGKILIDSIIINYAQNVFKTGKIQTRDFYYCPLHNKIHFDLIVPVFNDNKEVSAAVVFRSNPDEYLFPLIQEWPTPSLTAETYLVKIENDSIRYLTSLKHLSNNAFHLKLPVSRTEVNAVRAAKGKEGILEGLNYNGTKVLSDVRKIADTPWYIIAEIDTNEIYNDLEKRSVLIGTISLLSILLITAVLVGLYQYRQRNIYRELYEKRDKLFESQEGFRATLYSIGDGVITTDRDSIILQINPVAERMTGWSENEVCGKKLNDVFRIINEESNEIVENFQQSIINGEILKSTINLGLLTKRNNKQISVAISGAPIKNGYGNITGMVLVFRDQTDERMYLKKIKESEERSRSYFENAPFGIFIYDNEGICKEVNPSASILTGYSRSELLTLNLSGLLSDDSVEEGKYHFNSALKEGYANSELKFQLKNGEKRWFSVTCKKITNNTYLGFYEDINDKKLASDFLRQREFEMSEILGRMLNAFVLYESVFDEDGNFINCKFLYVNKAYEEIYKINSNELIDKTMLEIWPELNHEWIKRYGEVAVSGQSQEFELYHNSTEKILHCKAYRPFPNSTKFCIIFEDITKRREAESKIQASEEMYRHITENITDVVWSADLNLKTTYISQSVEKLLGDTPEMHMKRTMEEKFPPESLKMINDVLHDELEKEYISGADKSRSRLMELEHYHANGEKIWVGINVSFIRDENNKIIGLQGVTRNIAERKKIENELELKIIELEKFNKVMIGRENKMIELKAEVNELLSKLNKPKKYSAPDDIITN